MIFDIKTTLAVKIKFFNKFKFLQCYTKKKIIKFKVKNFNFKIFNYISRFCLLKVICSLDYYQLLLYILKLRFVSLYKIILKNLGLKIFKSKSFFIQINKDNNIIKIDSNRINLNFFIINLKKDIKDISLFLFCISKNLILTDLYKPKNEFENFLFKLYFFYKKRDLKKITSNFFNFYSTKNIYSIYYKKGILLLFINCKKQFFNLFLSYYPEYCFLKLKKTIFYYLGYIYNITALNKLKKSFPSFLFLLFLKEKKFLNIKTNQVQSLGWLLKYSIEQILFYFNFVLLNLKLYYTHYLTKNILKIINRILKQSCILTLKLKFKFISNNKVYKNFNILFILLIYKFNFTFLL